MQEENLTPYVEARWRWFPVTKAPRTVRSGRDPHRKSVHDQYASGTVTFEFTKTTNSPSSTTRTSGQAMNRVVNEKSWWDHKRWNERSGASKQVAG